MFITSKLMTVDSQQGWYSDSPVRVHDLISDYSVLQTNERRF